VFLNAHALRTGREKKTEYLREMIMK